MELKKLKEMTSSLKVLYIEDDLDLRRQNQEMFNNLFALVTVTSDGEKALYFYNKNEYDLVITDINIPKINGFSLIKAIQKINKDQIFLVTTVFKKDDFSEKIKDLNIKYILTKPISKKEMLLAIEKAVNEIYKNIKISVMI